MKLINKCLGLIALMFLSMHMNAQKIKTVDGDLSVLKSEESINIEFVYDGMSVGKYDKESDYIKAKTEEYNKKEQGRGDTWAKSWVTDRAGRFESRFINEFQDASKMTVKPTAKYTMIFKTTTTEPGYNIVISRKNAEIDAEVTIVETADRAKKLATLSVANAPGRIYGGYDYDTGTRIAESYAVAGKRLGKYIK
ncbi:MAG: hypothetical protein ABIO04_13905 [Ferruginibacter sp.]